MTLLSALPLLRHFTTALPSDLGDPALNTWILWWNAHARPLTDAWWNAPMFAPAPNAFALSESLLSLTPLTTPLIRAGVSPIATYNIVFLLAGPLSALAAYLLAWRLTHRRSAALVAALAFGFSPYRMAQLPHLQMQWTCWLPLALWCLHGYVESSRRSWLIGFGLCWLMTGFTNGYFLIFFPVLLALWVIWFARERRQIVSIVATFAAATLPLLPLLLAYRARQRAFGLARGIGEIQAFSADLSAFWAASRQSWLSWHWTVTPRAEGELYPGLAIAALTIAGAVVLLRADTSAIVTDTPGRRRTRRWLLVIGAAAIALSAAVAISGGWDLKLGSIVWTAHKISRSLTIAFWALVGAGLTSVALRAAWRRRSPLAFYLSGAGVMFVMALGPLAKAFGETVLYKAPYSFLMMLPGGDSVRVPARFGELMILCLSVAGALTWARLVKPGNRAATTLIALALLAEGWMVFPVAAAPAPLDVPPAIPADAAILELPMTLEYPPQTQALLHAIAHGHRIVNGFSGYDPPHFAALRDGLINGDDTVFAALRSSGPLAIFIDRTRDSDGAELKRVSAMPGTERVSTTSQGDWFVAPALTVPVAAAPGSPLTGLTVTASVHNEAALAMTDGKLNTRWTTGDSQQAGTTIQVSLGQTAAVSAIELTLGGWVGDFPTDLAIYTQRDGGSTVLWAGSVRGLTVLAALAAPRVVAIVIRFDSPVALSNLTIRNNTTDQKRAWSVAELKVFGR